MRRFLWILLIGLSLTVGCQSQSAKLEEYADAVPQLTSTMRSIAEDANPPADTDLPPEQVQEIFGEAIIKNPALDVFTPYSKAVRWCSEEQLILLVCDPKTGEALYEDASCTPRLDRQWYRQKQRPRTFTLRHPSSGLCKSSKE